MRLKKKKPNVKAKCFINKTKKNQLQKKNVTENKSLASDSPKFPSQCDHLQTSTYEVYSNHVACISLKGINELLDKPSSEVCNGVFVAPLFRGEWGAFAQIQIEPQMTHGPYLNTAQYMIGRVAAASEDEKNKISFLRIAFNKGKSQPLGVGMQNTLSVHVDVLTDFENFFLTLDGYFQIPANTTYTLSNQSHVHPVVISLQLFEKHAK